MQLLVFIIAYPLLWCISMLPFRLLYLLSDFLYIVVYRLVGYRKKTVRNNIKLALPELSPAERLAVEKKFYHHLTDLFLEMIKTLTASQKTIDKRFVYTNLDTFKKIEEQKSIILMFPHYAGWEWTVSLNSSVSSEGYAVYKQIRNPYFDRLVKKIRGKFGTVLIETRETIRVIRRNQLKNIHAIYAFLSDQSPMASKALYWQDFMGIKVPVHVGAEILAKRTDLAVVYLRIEKRKRGHYQATFVPLSTEPKTVPDYGITDLFLKEVEKQIHQAPEYYFWTHRRWKHKDKAPKQ
ncbi:lysophospholipid acyltransferase family protein [Sinomicrobium sp.]